MKTKSLMVMALIALFIGMGAVAEAATITQIVSADAAGKDQITRIAPAQRFFVLIQVDDATSIAGAAFTLNYDASLFEVIRHVPNQPTGTAITSSTEINPTQDFSSGLTIDGVLDSEAFVAALDNTGAITTTILRLANVNGTGKVMLSGAAINTNSTSGGGGPYTGPKTLFRIHFRAKSTATVGNSGQFSLSLTAPTTGGWNGTDTVWPLTGAAAKGTTAFGNLTSPNPNTGVTDCATYAFCNLAYSFGAAASLTVQGVPGVVRPTATTATKPTLSDVMYLYFHSKCLTNPSGDGCSNYATIGGNGDFNHDGKITLSDVMMLLYYYKGQPPAANPTLE